MIDVIWNVDIKLILCGTMVPIAYQLIPIVKFISDLHNGRIGEHLAAADIMMQGHECFHSAQGMPYDLVADIDGKLLKVQVKTTAQLRSVPQRASDIQAYLFWINRCGKKGRSVYSSGEIDLFALVALEEKSVGYIAPQDLPKTFFVRAERLRGKYHDEVLAERNNRVLSALGSGSSTKDVCKEFGIHKSYVSRLQQGKGFLSGVGVYMSDLTLDSALRGAANA